MALLDLVFVTILVVSALIGVSRGFVKEALSLLAWVVSFYLAWQFTDAVLADASVLMAYLKSHVGVPAFRTAIVFTGLFIGSMLVFSLINYVIDKLVGVTPLAALNKLLGMGFGLLRGAFIVAIIVAGLQATPVAEMQVWHQSPIVSVIQQYNRVLLDGVTTVLA